MFFNFFPYGKKITVVTCGEFHRRRKPFIFSIALETIQLPLRHLYVLSSLGHMYWFVCAECLSERNI